MKVDLVQPPDIVDYGLDEESIKIVTNYDQKMEKIKKKVNKYILFISTPFMLYLSIRLIIEDPLAILYIWVLLFFVVAIYTFLGVCIENLIILKCFKFEQSIKDRLEQYKKDKEKYIHWFTMTKEEYWRSFSGKGFRFESAVTELYKKLGYKAKKTKKQEMVE